jgi:enoyl-CoA hydratase/carnithine racemase
MFYDSPNFTRLRISNRDGVASITIDNPPVNVLDVRLMGEVRRFLASVRDDPDTRVIVLKAPIPSSSSRMST